MSISELTFNDAKDVSGGDAWDCGVCAAGVAGMVAANNPGVSTAIGAVTASSCQECISDIGNMIGGNSATVDSGNGGEGGGGNPIAYNSGGSNTSSASAGTFNPEDLTNPMHRGKLI